MKIFIDSANINEIRTAAEWGVIDGVTTNPTLMAKEGRDFKNIVNEICTIVDGPISVEAMSTKAEDIVNESIALGKINKNIVVKIPVTTEGLKATKILSKKNISVNMTLVFSPIQALFAAKAGARYVSPFIGRLDDIGHEGMDIISNIVRIYKNYNFDTEVIVASIRHPLHVVDAALIGAHIATCPFKVIEGLTKHPLTDIGIERFLKDWEKIR